MGSISRVLQPQRKLGRTVPLHVATPHPSGEQLEVGIPDPRDVAAVGDVVVEHAEQIVLARLQGERAQHLVGASRILDQQDAQLAPASIVTVSARPNAALVLSQARDDSLQRHLQRMRERGSGERVVNVVKAGERQFDIGGARGGVQREAR